MAMLLVRPLRHLQRWSVQLSPMTYLVERTPHGPVIGCRHVSILVCSKCMDSFSPKVATTPYKDKQLCPLWQAFLLVHGPGAPLLAAALSWILLSLLWSNGCVARVMGVALCSRWLLAIARVSYSWYGVSQKVDAFHVFPCYRLCFVKRSFTTSIVWFPACKRCNSFLPSCHLVLAGNYRVAQSHFAHYHMCTCTCSTHRYLLHTLPMFAAALLGLQPIHFVFDARMGCYLAFVLVTTAALSFTHYHLVERKFTAALFSRASS